MRSKLLVPVLALLAGVGIISCSDLITNTTSPMRAAHGAARDEVPTPKVRITQVYGAGGNSGALVNADFVELYNEGTADQDLSTWSIQYASATGTGNLGVTNQIVVLSGTIKAGQYYLVGMTAGANGTALPAPDATGNIAMAAGGGKVVLANQTTGLACNGSTVSCSAVASHIVDLVGYGNANFFEGTGGTPAPDASHSAVRKDVCVDSDDNAADFMTITPPAPRNSSTITALCAGGGGPIIGPLDHVVVTGTATVAAGATTTLGAELQDAGNHTISDPAATYTWASSDETKATVTATSANTATITGVAAGQTNITATATSSGVTKTSANFVVTVTGTTGPNNGPVTSNTIFVSEIHYDNVGTDANEALEIETPAGANLAGYTLALYDGTTGLTYPAAVAPMRIDSLTPTICPSGNRQVIRFNFPVNGLQNGSQDGATPTVPDGWAIIDPQGHPVELMSYEGTFVAASGAAANYLSTDIGKSEGSSTSPSQSLQRAGNGVWFGPSSNTMGACNPAEPVAPQTIIIQDRPTPLPVGFQTQFFIGTGSHDNHGATVGNSDVTWSSSAPSIISVDATSGILTGIQAGQAIITATAKSDSAIGTANVTAAILPTSPSARVGHNTELGTPTDKDPSDDIIISRRQYTLSYNSSHGDPNWVSWNLDATHKGTAPRCDCFSADPLVAAAGAPAYNTNEWINGGVWSRGHMSPSADWNVSDGDNAPTFYLSNMLPQNQTLNSGAWGDLENHLRDVATGSTEIYIIAGGIFTKGRTNGVDGFGYMNSIGHILVPDTVWKIAIIVPDGRAASGITSASDVQVIAAKFANAATGTGPYTNYLSTIDAIQKSTGYDFLSTLPENVQCRIESRNCAPAAAIAGPTSGNEGASLTFDATSSNDPDGGQLSYQWTVNGQVVGIGSTLNYAFPDNGTYAVNLVVSDLSGGSATASSSVSIANVNPTATFNAPATVNETSPITLSVSNLADPSTVDLNAGLKIDFDCGTGYGAAGSATSVSCPTTEDGSRTVHARITDKDGGSTIYTASVAILNVAPTVTFKAVTSTNIESGDIVATSGSFTDPGKDAPWTSSISWGDGQTTATLPSHLVVSGEKLLGGTQYKKLGTFTATLTITDNDGGAGSSSLTYTVSRRSVRGTSDPRIIRLSNAGGDDVTITLVRDLLANMDDIDVASVKIGSVGVTKKNNGKFDYQINNRGLTVELTFSKKALMNAGLLTSSTDELVLTGALTNGIQLISHVNVTTTNR